VTSFPQCNGDLRKLSTATFIMNEESNSDAAEEDGCNRCSCPGPDFID
jgi:hypothetical protein